jgi:D-alanyl-D-alanine dipeptidase
MQQLLMPVACYLIARVSYYCCYCCCCCYTNQNVYTVLLALQMKPRHEATLKVYDELRPQVVQLVALHSKLKLIQPTTAAIIQQVRPFYFDCCSATHNA